MPVDDTWARRDLPFLEAAVRGVDDRPVIGWTTHEIGVAAGLGEHDVEAAAQALETAGLISVQWTSDDGDVYAVSGQARQLAGSWPSEDNFADRLLAAVTALEEKATTDDERSRLQRLRVALSDVGRGLLVGVASSVISGEIPH